MSVCVCEDEGACEGACEDVWVRVYVRDCVWG